MSWAHYLLQVNIYLVIFYCFYRLLLDKETYFVLNRIYLIGSGLLSLGIPFMRFEWFSQQEVSRHIYVGVDQLNSLVAQVTILDDQAAKFNWGTFIVSVYLLGILFFLGRFVFQLLAVRKLFSSISKGTAFSFFRKKVVSTDLPEIATVSLHEDIHIKQLHTVDVLFFELLGIFTWFNPIIYAYKYTVKNIHEFLADEAAAKFQGDKETYSLLLLSQAFGVRPNTLTNGFLTKSLIKKRIFMLHKERSKKTAILKYGLFVPLFSLTLVLSSATIRKNNKILAVAQQIPLNDAKAVVGQLIQAPLSVVNLAPPPPPDSTVKTTAVIVNQFMEPATAPVENTDNSGASLNSFFRYLSERVKYPATAIQKKIQGNVVVNFSVINGKLQNVLVQNEIGEGCEEEVMQTLLNYDDLLQKDGKYSLKVTFKLDGATSKMLNEEANNPADYTPINLFIQAAAPKEKEPEEAKPEDKTIYNFVTLENPPSYPGGVNKFYEFLAKNIKYPTQAIENDIQGNVFVSFTVEKDGSLSDIRLDRRLGFGTDEEAIRVLKLSKNWNPGTQNGKAVRVKYNIPIKFALDAGKREKISPKSMAIRLKGLPEKDAPLVVLDGEIKEYAALKDIDASTIKSVDVLNSASGVALYGKVAENGALLITSKQQKIPKVTATLINRN
ncbi:TonB family protein [Pedobacter sp. ASV12]|uniref:TonB family protein n=1 Tax=Pedobacter sp. ASV12 TaxID=2795120 RepID=UPI0018EDC5D5|nr:TonB family protein [Pedobacter sp. ASV12]